MKKTALASSFISDINIIDRTNDYYIDDTILNLAEEFEERDKEARREHENKRVYQIVTSHHHNQLNENLFFHHQLYRILF